MSTATMGRTEVLPISNIDPDTGEPRLAHIIGPQGKKDGVEFVMEGRIMGTPVEALCGKVLVPSHNPDGLENCSKCQKAFEEQTGHSDGWKDA